MNIAQTNYGEAPLHVLEHQLKLPVDLGMFFFGLCNAGVQLDSVGGLTLSVIFALIVGKTVGIACFSLLAVLMGFSLPSGLSIGDLWALSGLGGVGLTVALFVANEAFVDPDLQGQAKFAAVLSILSAGVAWLIRVLTFSKNLVEDDVNTEAPCSEEIGGPKQFIEDLLVDEALNIMWVQGRYSRRGVEVPFETIAGSRSTSKRPSLTACSAD
mmetsp:Transcript_54006/g.168672  ORF Transcript_54006/g.168672 Transcript_54006/m.168672 type:complete len:213 (-) Transcript_54006:45-683(-)